jgi:hypothetical protein
VPGSRGQIGKILYKLIFWGRGQIERKRAIDLRKRVGPTDHKTNRMEVCSDLVAVSWTNRLFNPEASAKRSEIQRIRHTEDPVFHELALSNLKKGRLTEWKKEQILQAIRDFQAQNGRPPRYEELRASNGLPDYKTIWRKFGSSRDAIEAANSAG